jgi:hypothetical protein
MHLSKLHRDFRCHDDLPLALREITQLRDKCLEILALHDILASRRAHERGSSYLICQLRRFTPTLDSAGRAFTLTWPELRDSRLGSNAD